MFQTYYPNGFSSKLLWLALLQTCIRDIIDNQHYTVDMILAVVVTSAVWGWTRGIYPEDRPLPKLPEGAEAGRPNTLALLLVVVGLATAAVAVFVAKS
jgi:DNA mismatch repair protein MutS2